MVLLWGMLIVVAVKICWEGLHLLLRKGWVRLSACWSNKFTFDEELGRSASEKFPIKISNYFLMWKHLTTILMCGTSLHLKGMQGAAPPYTLLKFLVYRAQEELLPRYGDSHVLQFRGDVCNWAAIGLLLEVWVYGEPRIRKSLPDPKSPYASKFKGRVDNPAWGSFSPLLDSSSASRHTMGSEEFYPNHLKRLPWEVAKFPRRQDRHLTRMV